jgi:RNA polymerase sigma factor (sigma-70 family)
MFELDTSFRKQLFDEILEELKTMPSPQREVFTLRHYHGQSDQEIARTLGIDTSRVSLLLREAESMIHQGIHMPRPSEEE